MRDIKMEEEGNDDQRPIFIPFSFSLLLSENKSLSLSLSLLLSESFFLCLSFSFPDFHSLLDHMCVVFLLQPKTFYFTSLSFSLSFFPLHFSLHLFPLHHLHQCIRTSNHHTIKPRTSHHYAIVGNKLSVIPSDGNQQPYDHAYEESSVDSGFKGVGKGATHDYRGSPPQFRVPFEQMFLMNDQRSYSKSKKKKKKCHSSPGDPKIVSTLVGEVQAKVGSKTAPSSSPLFRSPTKVLGSSTLFSLPHIQVRLCSLLRCYRLI